MSLCQCDAKLKDFSINRAKISYTYQIISDLLINILWLYLFNIMINLVVVISAKASHMEV